MRILAFSDLHRDIEAAKAILASSHHADVVVGAGDFSTRGQGAEDTLAILREIAVPVVIVHGNHDDVGELARLVEHGPNIHLLHGTPVTISGKVFFGLGGEVPTRNPAKWNSGMTETEAKHLLASCPEGAVLATHSPPLGHCDLQRDGSNEGSAAILACIEDRKPSLVLCGHIHNAWGMRSKVGTTLIHNIGPNSAWHDA